jgi:hypothetical protein
MDFVKKAMDEAISMTALRQEMRRDAKEKLKKIKTLNMTVDSLEASLKAAREDEHKKMKDLLVDRYSTAVAIVLHDKWGFGKKRLPIAIQQINEVFDNILDGEVSFEDIKDARKEEKW